MLSHIVEFSLRHRGAIIATACAFLLWGSNHALQAKLDVFPDFVPPRAVIQTEAPGLVPEQVEQLVTLPLEAALGGLASLDTLRSESIQGLSVVRLVFRDGTDTLWMRQMLAERLTTLAGQLPPGVGVPTVEPLTSATMDVLKVGLVSDRLGPMELRDLATWTVARKLRAVRGVARVNIFGGEIRQLQILVRPEDLLAHQIAVSDVISAARRATGLVGAGFADTPNQRIVLRSEGQIAGVEDLRDAVITNAGPSPVRMRDVADVAEAAAPKFGDALIQGQPGVLLTISSQYGTNTLDVTRDLEAALSELSPLFAKNAVRVYPRLHRPASFIENALRNLRFSLLLGAALVFAVLFIFLRHWQTTLISLVAIPLSLLGAVIILERLGMTINTMTLGGLAIALGEVVDDAIIDLENIVRRLRENSQRADPKPSYHVVLAASLEVRSAIICATTVVVLVFLPLLTLSGLAGAFFAPLGLAYLFAVASSLIVALTLTPALALVFCGGGLVDAPEPALQSWIKRHYRALLSRLMGHPRPLLIGALAAAGVAAAALPFLGGGFLPQFREGHLVLQVSEAPGASIEEMLRLGRSISAGLLAIPGVSTVAQQVGRATQGEDTWPPHRSEFHIELDPRSSASEPEISEQVRALLASDPGIEFEVLTFLGDRISETLTGETAPVVVNVFGTELDALDTTASKIARVLASVPGASEVRIAAPPGLPSSKIVLRRVALAQFGFLPVDVLDAIRTAYRGEPVAQIFRADRREDIVVMLAGHEHGDAEHVGSLLVRSAGGTVLPLRELASIEPTSDRVSILHEGGRRRQTVTCVPRGRDVTSFVAAARQAVRESVALPAGQYVEWSGAAQAQRQARHELLVESSVSAFGILLVLALAFRNARALALVMANVPFSLVGGVLSLLLVRAFAGREAGLTMGSLVGFVTLFGITMRNSIMLISHYQHLVDEECGDWNLETVIRGAADRVIPILMTALVASLGLLPLAIGSGSAGREIEGPMAIVILGGIASSTIMNLLVLPTLAHRFARFTSSPSPAPRTDASPGGVAIR
jgi:CzcA family heavy metal efflux pump